MNHLDAGRVLMGDSLGFHILFALLGVGLPLVFLTLEYLGIRRKNPALIENARLWSYVAAVLVVTGVMTGTTVALQMFLIWPGILDFGGNAIGLGFTWEGYAFIIEAVFLALYVKTWGQVTGIKHLLLGVPILLGATLSAVLITAVNAWMNHPTGFDVVNGAVVNPRPLEALFTVTTFVEASHSILSYFLTVCLLAVGAYAWMLLRHKKPKIGDLQTTRTIMITFSVMSLVLLSGVAILGDVSAKYLAKHEPTKLAAMEGLKETQTNAPLILGGTPQEDGSIKGGVTVPGALSFFAGNSTDTEVKGLSETPKHLWPPLVIHTLFDIKLLLIAFLIVIPTSFTVLYFKARARAFSRPMLGLLVSLPIMSVITLELGWMLTEIGRQPYAVYGHVLTEEAFTTNQGVLQLAWLFPAVFILYAVATFVAVRFTIKRFRPLRGRAK